jgi:hypothetical protein
MRLRRSEEILKYNLEAIYIYPLLAEPMLVNIPEQVDAEAIPHIRYARIMRQLNLPVPTRRSSFHIYGRAKSVRTLAHISIHLYFTYRYSNEVAFNVGA